MAKPTIPKLSEIAARINVHLKRMEAAQAPFKPGQYGADRFYCAGCHYVRGSRFISVTYIAYQGSTNLTREEATTYLEALDSGISEKHQAVLGRISERKAKGK